MKLVFSSFRTSSPNSILLTVVVILVLWSVYRFIIQRVWFTPLSVIPGPKYASLTSIYLDLHYLFETGITYIEKLHEQFGPIVRVGPSEVVINDPEQLQSIYGIRSTLSKPPSAILFQNYGCANAFSSITKDEHRQRRKATAKAYTMSTLHNNDRLMGWLRNRLDIILDIVDTNLGKSLDFFPIATRFALDSVSFQVYGKSLNLLEGQNLQAAKDIRNAAIAGVPILRFPVCTKILSVWPCSLIMPSFLRDAISSNQSLDALHLDQIRKVTRSGTKLDPERTTIGFIQQQAEHDKALTNGHIASESLDHVVAGTDTTAVSIIYLLHELSLPQNLKYQSKLQKEISSLPQPLDFREVCNLPYLNSCVYESLRLHPPGPGSLQERWTTSETVLTVKGKVYHIPSQTSLVIQPQSLHHNREVFSSDVKCFRPERWEGTDAARLQKMKEAWIPFGTGARTCLGMSLAIIELKAIIAALLYSHSVCLPPNPNLEDMQPVFAGVIRPKGERCDLVFNPL